MSNDFDMPFFIASYSCHHSPDFTCRLPPTGPQTNLSGNFVMSDLIDRQIVNMDSKKTILPRIFIDLYQ